MTTQGSTARAWAVGGMVFAAAMMVMLGIWQIFVGIAAIAEDDFFVVAPNYTYEIDTTTWGWIHLILGVVVTVTGLFLFTGAAWARAVGIALAVLSAIANFFFLPYYPLWSIMIIAVNVFVIWALATASSSRATNNRVASEPTDGRTATDQPAGGNGWSASQQGTPAGRRPAAS